MADVKIRIKLGNDEFEGEGAAEIIEPHLAAFLKLVKGVSPVPAEIQGSATASFRKTVRQTGRVAFFTAPGRIPTLCLLILFAQKMFLKNDSVTGAQIMEGLRQSGLKIPRADYILMSHAKDGYVTYKGSARARKYSLTQKGVEHAERLVPSHIPPA